MAEIIRNRTIRPSTRSASSAYKVKTDNVGSGDILTVNIDHEDGGFNQSYTFKGVELVGRNSIHFKVKETSGNIKIEWSGVEPLNSGSIGKEANTSKPKKKPATEKVIKQGGSNAKTSFSPIADKDTEILILGTMPGEKSLLLQEYYAHPRNKFWKILSSITKEPLPSNYREKEEFLLKNKIGIWDVAHSANRKGSLDSAIQNEVPNDIPGFIKSHPKLKGIAFNGAKAESLFDNYFERSGNITYVSLPSSSPANTGFTFESICKRWEKMLD